MRSVPVKRHMKFVKGMDLSTLLELERCGAKYYDNGEERDLLAIMKSYDVDTVSVCGMIRGRRPANLMARGRMI